MKIDAGLTYYDEINKKIRAAKDFEIEVENCLGQRYIGCGLSGKNVVVNGTPGNALGAYLNGGNVKVFGNAQDATGDTMNDGKIFIHGSSGDATGYAMRGGKIFVQGNAGYRAGIHMKAYKDKTPVLVIGGKAGSFLGEYQAGGYIIVLGLGHDKGGVVERFCATGMHGGKIFLRCDDLPYDLPEQVIAKKASKQDLDEIEEYLDEYINEFGGDKTKIMKKNFYVLIPDTKNPYKQIYTAC